MRKITEKSEITRLSRIYKGLPPNQMKVVEGLIVEAARLRVRLDYLWRDLQENGETELFTQSEKTEPYERERPQSRTYTATIFYGYDKDSDMRRLDPFASGNPYHYTATGSYVIGFQLVSINPLIYCCNDCAISPSGLSADTALTVEESDTAAITVQTASPGAVTFTSGDTSVATVSDKGVVTGVSAGTVQITVAQAASNTYPAGSVKVAVTVTAASGGSSQGSNPE
mgnify:CR=1 FL=1